MAKKTAIVLAPAAELETSVKGLSEPLSRYLAELSLPTDDVLVPVNERKIVIDALAGAISVLPITDRQKATYLSKYVVAASLGLFDAALNYLWDETIQALRRLVATTDLAYFFDTAEKRPEHRKKLSGPDDLAAIEDFVLLDTCARIGLISDLNRERLRHVNYMRNHASAAHPNQNSLNGSEMIGWLANCIRYAITAKPDLGVVHTQRLLQTVRERAMSPTDIPLIVSEIQKLPQERIDDLLWTLFGMYTTEGRSANVHVGVEQLGPGVWQAASEARRYEVGARHAEFMRRGEQARRQLADDFLKRVGGEGYRSEDVLAFELLEKLRTLHHTHNAFNNFYNEWPHAMSLAVSLPVTKVVPRAALNGWVYVNVECWVGNGIGYRQGVDEKALPYYQANIDLFGEREIVEMLNLLSTEEFTVAFNTTKGDARLRQLTTQLRPRAQNVFVQQGLDLILAAPPGTLRQLALTAAFKQVLQNLPKFTT